MTAPGWSPTGGPTGCRQRCRWPVAFRPMPREPRAAALPQQEPAMSDERLCWLPATALSGMYRSKEVSPTEVVDAVLDRLERVNPDINAFVTVLADQARAAARQADD